jgi:phosphotransferase system HPr (HPr) family protein
VTDPATGPLVAELLIANEKGIHTRTATELVKLAQTFESSIRISLDHTEADARSVIELLTLGARKGKTVKVTVEGPDRETALAKIRELIEGGFNGVDA